MKRATDHPIPHLPFFQRLADAEAQSADWYRARGGLLVLRLLDGLWAGQQPDRWNVRAIRTALSEIPRTDHLQALLLGIVDAAERTGWTRPAGLLARLMAVGRALDYSAEWPLAMDVYRTVLQHADPETEGEIAVDAAMRIGFCARMVGRWDEAMEAYLQAGRMADAIGDGARRLRVGAQQAVVVRLRGNLPAAEAMLDETIALCAEAADTELLAPVLHERAIVAFMRQQFHEGLEFANRSLELETDAALRDRVLVDMASAFLELGLHSAARDAYLLVEATAQEQWTRWLAAINLMELAALEASETAFHAYRSRLQSAPLPPPLRAGYYVVAGRGYCLFGQMEEGRRLLEQGSEFAREHEINELYMQAETALASPPAAHRGGWGAAPIPEQLEPIVTSLRHRREKAGA